MKKVFMSIWIIALSFPGLCQVEELRSLYFAATTETGKIAFRQRVEKVNESEPVVRAYKGVAIAMYADVVSGVNQKFSWFEKGRKLIESAVASDPSNPEIAFLRFSVQSEVPWIVDYDDNLAADANTVLSSLRRKIINPGDSFWSKALHFMEQSGELDSAQLIELKKFNS